MLQSTEPQYKRLPPASSCIPPQSSRSSYLHGHRTGRRALLLEPEPALAYGPHHRHRNNTQRPIQHVHNTQCLHGCHNMHSRTRHRRSTRSEAHCPCKLQELGSSPEQEQRRHHDRHRHRNSRRHRAPHVRSMPCLHGCCSIRNHRSRLRSN